MLDDLHERLRRTRLPEEPAGAGWEHGTNLAYMLRLLRYWQSEYDWRQVEARLNRLPQHRASLGGYQIHLVYKRGSGPRPLPLVITHGWPGAFVEFATLIGPLAHPEREFDPIKDFIWSGAGNAGRFVGQRRADQVILNWRLGQGPAYWMHILGVERTYDRIVGWFQSFAGPRSLPPLYEVNIGMDPSRIVRRREQRAHQFVILDPQAADGIIGVMEDLEPANYIRPALR